MHIAVIGTGRIGQTVAFTLAHESFVTELSLVDIIPELAETVAEEMRHSTASTHVPIVFHPFESSSQVSKADIVIVSAGFPRTPAMRSRRELVAKNADIIKSIAEEITPGNRGARYIIVTNPVDAMSTLFAKYSRGSSVIGTGTSLDSLRFRSELSRVLGVPIDQIEGFVGGEHGENAVCLWSTVRVKGKALQEHLAASGVTLDRGAVEQSVKQTSRKIIRVLGGTRFGPASAFMDIIRSIALDEKMILPVAAPYSLEGLPQPVYIGIPRTVGWNLGPTLENSLTAEEREDLREAARAVWKTYKIALETLGD
ncbi:MAG: malate dehydrogenase [Candidatus Geothermarchaeales archaeon]